MPRRSTFAAPPTSTKTRRAWPPPASATSRAISSPPPASSSPTTPATSTGRRARRSARRRSRRRTTYDALNRVLTATTPDESVTTPTFNERSLLAAVTVNLRGAATASTFVQSAAYDAKGQRQSIAYGNGASHHLHLRPETFRLTELTTTRPGGDSARSRISATPTTRSGTSPRIADAAQQTIFFNNQVVTPSADYTYDAIYRLDPRRPAASTSADGVRRRRLERRGHDRPAAAVTTPRRCATTPRRTPTTPSATSSHYALSGRRRVDPHLRLRRADHAAGQQPADLHHRRRHHRALRLRREREHHLDAAPVADAVGLEGPAAGHREPDRERRNYPRPPTTATTPPASGSPRPPTAKAARSSAQRTTSAPTRSTASTTPPATRSPSSARLCTSPTAQRICLLETTTDSTPRLPPWRRRAPPPATSSATTSGRRWSSWTARRRSSPTRSTTRTAAPRSSAGASAAEVSLKRYRYTGKERDTENGFYYHGARYCAPWLAGGSAAIPPGCRRPEPVRIQPRPSRHPQRSERHPGAGPR